MILLDQQLFIFLHNLVGKSRLLDLFVAFFADYFGYFVILGAIYLFISHQKIENRYRNFLFTILAIIISRGIVTEILKYFVSRPRPFAALMFDPLVRESSLTAFPSGHTVLYFTLAFCVFYLLGRNWGFYFIGSAFIIALSRILAGVHWPTDIVGGIIIAYLGFFITYALLKERKIKQP